MSEKKKILVDAHTLDGGFQGTQTFLSGLYNAVHEQYKDVELYFATANKDAVKATFPFVEPQHLLEYKKRNPAVLRMVLDMPDLLRQHNFAAAHFQYMVPMGKTDFPVMLTTHDVLFRDFPKYFSWSYAKARHSLFGNSIRRADICTTVSPYSKNRICHHYGVAPEQVSLLPNAVDTAFGTNMNLSEAVALVKEQYGLQKFILYVSRVEPRKNHLQLLEVYLRMKLWQRGVALVFIGDTTIQVPALQQKLRRLQPAPARNIHWLKDLPRLHLEALYKACRCFVYPSLAEGFGIPPLEAAVCGAPVLCSNTTAMGDFDFFDPYMYNPSSEKELLEKLDAILDESPEADFLQEVAASVRERYSWKKTAAIWYQLINKKAAL